MVNHHLRRQPLQQRQLPLRRQPHLCRWHVPRYQATHLPRALGAMTSLVELSADLPLELAALEIIELGHRSSADAAARREARTLLPLRRQPLQRQLPGIQTGLASTSRAAYATLGAKFPP